MPHPSQGSESHEAPRSCLASSSSRPATRQRSNSHQPTTGLASPHSLHQYISHHRACFPPRIRSPSNPPPSCPSSSSNFNSAITPSSSLPSQSPLSVYGGPPQTPDREQRKPLLRRLSTSTSNSSFSTAASSSLSPQTPQDLHEPLLACCVECEHTTDVALAAQNADGGWDTLPFSRSALEKRKKDAKEAAEKERMFATPSPSKKLPDSATGASSFSKSKPDDGKKVAGSQEGDGSDSDEQLADGEGESALARKLRENGGLLVDEVSMARRASQTSLLQLREEMERNLSNSSLNWTEGGRSPFQSNRQSPRLTPQRYLSQDSHDNSEDIHISMPSHSPTSPLKPSPQNATSSSQLPSLASPPTSLSQNFLPPFQPQSQQPLYPLSPSVSHTQPAQPRYQPLSRSISTPNGSPWSQSTLVSSSSPTPARPTAGATGSGGSKMKAFKDFFKNAASIPAQIGSPAGGRVG
jgi:hypothetical protein